MSTESSPSRSSTFWREWAKPILTAVLALCALRSSLADWNDVPTPSMVPTILEGDRVFIDKRAYDWRVPFLGWRIAAREDPERGDIVIFPSPVDGIRLIKRVVGLPGDTIELRGDRLVVNGEPARYDALSTATLQGCEHEELGGFRVWREAKDGLDHPMMTERGSLRPSDFGPFEVPAGHYFMMGDNRDRSLDSRAFGAVPREAIRGKALAVALSVDPDRAYRPRFARWFSRLP
ncbi:MAG: signal peptidase I [Planctomycetota bacterium JB042]